MTVRRIPRAASGFPQLLRRIHDPPAVVWVRGDADLSVLDASALVAVVGARACSSYGRGVARSLGRELAAAGAVVVSGLARGIDGEAHRGALDGGGPTVAVLGCGIDRDYPAAHRELASRIVAAGGLVLSEYEPGVEPAPWRFPARNRLIAGLCHLTVVVEARQRSGALITADMALEQGRDVMAVPGEITSGLAAGTNGLIRQGAAPVTAVADVLEALGLTARVEERTPLSAVEATVLRAVASGPLGADDVVRATGLETGVVAAALVELELAGRVSADDGAYRSTIAG